MGITDTLGCECACCVYVNSGEFLEGVFIRTHPAFHTEEPVKIVLSICVLLWCDFDRASSLICGNKMPARWNRGFYCRSYCLLNMFRAPLCPSSGAQEYYTVVVACGILCCGFQVAGLGGVEGCVSGLQDAAASCKPALLKVSYDFHIAGNGLYTMLVITLKESKTSKHVSILYQL